MEEETKSEEEVKEKMRQFLKADNALRRPNAEPGIITSIAKIILFLGLIGGLAYGIYVWHPWKMIADTKDGPDIGDCEYGYETTRAIEILGFRFNESKSVICKKDIIVE